MMVRETNAGVVVTNIVILDQAEEATTYAGPDGNRPSKPKTP